MSLGSKSKYDRQIRTYGIESIRYLDSSNVYILNPDDSLSTEIGKNLALSGVRNIHIYDNNSLELKDYLVDLNPSINIKLFNDYNDIIKGSIIVVVNNCYEDIIKNDVLKTLRNQNECKIIYGWENHYSGTVYVDVGDNHHITIPNDFKYEMKQIDKIVDNIVYIEKHGYNNDDVIVFKNLQNVELNNNEFKIYEVSQDSFQIDLTQNINFVNGFVQKTHTPINTSSKPIWK